MSRWGDAASARAVWLVIVAAAWLVSHWTAWAIMGLALTWAGRHWGEPGMAWAGLAVAVLAFVAGACAADGDEDWP